MLVDEALQCFEQRMSGPNQRQSGDVGYGDIQTRESELSVAQQIEGLKAEGRKRYEAAKQADPFRSVTLGQLQAVPQPDNRGTPPKNSQ